MSELKFTPGPWQSVNATDVFTPLAAKTRSGKKAPKDDGWHIADCQPAFSDMPHSEMRANAALIAAAPELYEALENASTMLRRVELESSDEYQAAMRVLAKARGES